jgi:hypothetical protein
MNRGGSYSSASRGFMGAPSARFNPSTRGGNYNHFSYSSPAARGFNSPSTSARNDGGWHSFGAGNSARGPSTSGSSMRGSTNTPSSNNFARNGASPMSSSPTSRSFSPPGSNVAHPSFGNSGAFGNSSFGSSRSGGSSLSASNFGGNHFGGSRLGGSSLGAGTAARFGPSASVVGGSHLGAFQPHSNVAGFNSLNHSNFGGNYHSSYIYGGHGGYGWGGYGGRGYGWGGGYGWRGGYGGWGGYGWRGGWGWGGWGWGWGGWGWGWGLGFGWGWGGWGWGWGGWGYPYWGPGWGGYWGWGYPYWGYPGYAYPSYNLGSSNPCDPSWNDQYSDYCGGGSNGVSYNLNNMSAPQDYSSSNTQPSGQEDNSAPSYAIEGSPNDNSVTDNVAASTPTVLIYLKDGTMFAATDYWMAGDELHYVVSYAGESAVSLDQLDWQRTVDENSKRGVKFTLKNKPDTAPASTSPDQGATSSPAVTPATPQATPTPAPSAPASNTVLSPA